MMSDEEYIEICAVHAMNGLVSQNEEPSRRNADYCFKWAVLMTERRKDYFNKIFRDYKSKELDNEMDIKENESAHIRANWNAYSDSGGFHE